MANGNKALAKEAEPQQEQKAPVEMVELSDAQHFEVRTITEADWKKAGVPDGKLIHWYSGNNFRVPRSEFDFLSESDFARCITADPRLIVVLVEEDSAPTEE